MNEKEYIECEVLIKQFETLKEKAETLRDVVYLDGVLAVIDTTPTANVQEVRHGKWNKVHEHIILADGSVKEWDNFFCSNCEEVSNCPTKYCPCCGAKIDKE